MSDSEDEFKSFLCGCVLTVLFMWWIVYGNMLPQWDGTFEKNGKTFQVKIIAVEKMVPVETEKGGV
jgi:hypothetical protein